AEVGLFPIDFKYPTSCGHTDGINADIFAGLKKSGLTKSIINAREQVRETYAVLFFECLQFLANPFDQRFGDVHFLILFGGNVEIDGVKNLIDNNPDQECPKPVNSAVILTTKEFVAYFSSFGIGVGDEMLVYTAVHNKRHLASGPGGVTLFTQLNHTVTKGDPKYLIDQVYDLLMTEFPKASIEVPVGNAKELADLTRSMELEKFGNNQHIERPMQIPLLLVGQFQCFKRIQQSPAFIKMTF
ncbi:MAG: hypothetical protein GY816_20720, partial [Cytophagales bacterium]|nr:hypothetical protein [Cytophagales bacterium]